MTFTYIYLKTKSKSLWSILLEREVEFTGRDSVPIFSAKPWFKAEFNSSADIAYACLAI